MVLLLNKNAVITESSLELDLKDSADLMTGFSIKETKNSSFDEIWEPVWGETKKRNHYDETEVHLAHVNSTLAQ